MPIAFGDGGPLGDGVVQLTAMHLSITILVDNRAGQGLSGEHGFALWIETRTERILFDTGQGAALADNARKLGVGLEQTDRIVLSHGHYDHTGGIPGATSRAPQAEVYCHPGVVLPRYSIRNGAPKPIQMPRESMTALDKLPSHQLHWVQQPARLAEEVGITGPIPRETGFEDTGGPFYLDAEGKRSDPITDDLAVWIRTAAGLVVCVGCSHAGLVNTLNHVLRLNPGSRIRAVVGGFHLLNASAERVDRTIAGLRSLKPDRVVPCHCTGENAAKKIGAAFGHDAVLGQSGMRLQF